MFVVVACCGYICGRLICVIDTRLSMKNAKRPGPVRRRLGIVLNFAFTIVPVPGQCFILYCCYYYYCLVQEVYK